MGSTTLKSESATQRRIKSIYIHPEYQRNSLKCDVAVVEFDEEVEFNDYVQRVCLPYLPMDEGQYKENTLITTSGYYNIDSCNASELLSSLKTSNSQVHTS